MSDTEKEGIRYRVAGEGELSENQYDTFYMVKFNQETRRSVNLYQLIDKITLITGEKPKAVRGNNSTSVTMEVKSREQAEKIKSLTEVEGFKRETTVHPDLTAQKEIYVHECEIEDIQGFKEFLQELYKVKDVQSATFIKTKNPQNRAFIPFSVKTIYLAIYVYREKDTAVYKFLNKPLI